LSKIIETGTSSLKVQERNKNKIFLFFLVNIVYNGNLLTYLSDSLPIYTDYVNSTHMYKMAVKLLLRDIKRHSKVAKSHQ